MKSIWIYTAADGASAAKPLPLPFRHMDRPMDVEIFKRQARGEDIGKPRLFPSGGLRAVHVTEPRDTGWQQVQERNLSFVTSGHVELSTGDGSVHILGPGDAFFEDDRAGAGHRVRYEGDCCLLKLLVADDWTPSGAVPSELDSPVGKALRKPNLKRMYKAENGKSYFRAFDNLFPSSGTEVTEARPVKGFHFISFPPSYFIDWHPEGCNNFVIVTEGELELEVSGDGKIEVFGPGDVCLAEDVSGEGHIDRAHGLNRLVLVVFEDERLWPVGAAQAIGADA